jgi:hypothetical protein
MSDLCAVLEIDNPRTIAARLDDDEPEAGSGVAKMASADVLVSRNVHSPNGVVAPADRNNDPSADRR